MGYSRGGWQSERMGEKEGRIDSNLSARAGFERDRRWRRVVALCYSSLDVRVDPSRLFVCLRSLATRTKLHSECDAKLT